MNPFETSNDRAVAGLLDFLTAMVIVIGGITVYFTASAMLLEVQDEQGTAVAHAGVRAEERLVDDVLRNRTGDATISSGCARSFFREQGNRSCGFEDRGSGQPYLRGVLGLGEQYELNVTLERADGIAVFDPTNGSDPVRHALGEPIPRASPVTTYYRTVSYGTDDDGDGRVDFYTVYVRLWEVA